MAENVSPLSYQTTMPEYPDVSYEAYQRQYGYSGNSRFSTGLGAWWDGAPNYETWRTNHLDQYNAQMSAYNTWLQTGAGQRASLLSGDYNPSYFGGQSASAEGINPGPVSEGAGFSEMAQGISGIISFAQALQGFKAMSASIAGQLAENENIKKKGEILDADLETKRINNRYLDSILGGKVTGLNFQNDKRQAELEELFYPRWSKRPELWQSGVFSPYGRGTYDLRDVENSFGYQRAATDLKYLDAGVELRKSQEALNKASKREKDWYFQNIFNIQKSILEHQRDILKGNLDFLPTEQQLRKWGQIANIGTGVIDSLVNAVSTFLPGVGIAKKLGGLWDSGPKSTPFPYRRGDYGTYGDNDWLDFGGFGTFSPNM